MGESSDSCWRVCAQLAFAVSSVVALGLCAAIFVASNQGEDGDAISNILNPAMRSALAQVALARTSKPVISLAARTSKLVLGAGQEDADMKAIQTAWATFQDSENASVGTLSSLESPPPPCSFRPRA